MVLETVVVIGSRKYRNKQKMEEVLYVELFWKRSGEQFVIMSGRCPMEDSVDNWAIEWCNKAGYLPVEVPPRGRGTSYYFERNEQMAHYADRIIAFVPNGLVKSGVKNCISEFRKMGKRNYTIYDEDGNIWDWW